MHTAHIDEAPAQPVVRKRVRAYLGEHLISDYSAEPELADRYVAAMRKHFAGLEWVVDDLPAGEREGRPLPGERLWEIAP